MNKKKNKKHFNLYHFNHRIFFMGFLFFLLIIQVIFASSVLTFSSNEQVLDTTFDDIHFNSEQEQYGYEILGGIDGYYSAGYDFVMDNENYTYAISPVAGLTIFKYNGSSHKFALVSRLDDNHGGFKILLNEKMAYALSEHGITVFNVTDPMSPKINGFYAHDNAEYTMMLMKENVLYVLTRAHLWIYDISTPSILLLVNALEFPDNNAMLGMTLSGNQLYIIDYDNGIYILDTSNSVAPQLIGHVSIESPRYIYASGDLVYVGGYDPLHIYQFENNNLTLKAVVDDFYTFKDAIQVGSYVHFVGGSTYTIFDVHDLSNVTRVMKFTRYSSYYALLVLDAEKKTVISQGNDGFVTVDYSDFKQPREAASSPVPRKKVVGTVVVNDLLFVLTSENGIYVYDFTDPKNPRLTWTYEDSYTRYSIMNYTNYVFVNGIQGVEVFYVSNSRTIEYKGIVSGYATRSYYDPLTSKIFIACGGYLSIYHLTLDPFNAQWVQDVSIGGVYSVLDGVPQGDYLFIASRNYGFYALKYNASSNNYNAIASYQDSSAEFTRVFAPSWTQDVFVVDKKGSLLTFTLESNSSGYFLVKVGEYSGSSINDVYLRGTSMYLIDSSAIVFVNATNPRNLVKLFSFKDYDLLENPKDVFYYNHITIVTCLQKVVPVRVYHGAGPQAPTDLSITTLNNKIKLTWNAPTQSGDAPIQYYKVYREIAEESTGVLSHSFTYVSKVSADTTEFLDPIEINASLTYNYYVVAVNSISESEPSNTVTIQGSLITSTTTSSSSTSTSSSTTSSSSTTLNSDTTINSETEEEGGLDFNMSVAFFSLVLSVFLTDHAIKTRRKRR